MTFRPARLAALTGVAALALAGLTPLSASAAPVVKTAPASAVQAAPVLTAKTTGLAAGPLTTASKLDTARAKVSYPKGSRAYAPITYTWTVWRSYVFEGEALVLYTDIHRSNVSKIRFTRKAPNATCGVRRESTDYNVYCIVTRPEKWKRFSMQFKVWPKRVSSVIADHYWGGAEFGGSAADYISQVGDRLGRTKTRLYY
ncbi:hypothetical protein [Nonomuraea sp. NPDC050310]|uniref:hypothetical protein n=1 Tax=unclassified Nonomuraea TaxID=2593643 RepID=UPI0033FC9609